MLASMSARLVSKFSIFRGPNNPYYHIIIPKSLRRFWQFLEFISLLSIVFVKFLVPSFLGYLVIAKKEEELECLPALEFAVKLNDAIENGLVEAPYKIPVHTWTKLLAQKILRDPLARSTSKNLVKTLGTKRGIKLLKSKFVRESY